MSISSQVELLLIEDSETDARLVMSMLALSARSPKVEWVKTGEDALDCLFHREIRPRLILLDILVPGIDGLDLLYRIKRGVETREIPVIMITAMENEKIIVSSYKLGVTAFVSKPLRHAALLEAFEAAKCQWMLGVD